MGVGVRNYRGTGQRGAVGEMTGCGSVSGLLFVGTSAVKGYPLPPLDGGRHLQGANFSVRFIFPLISEFYRKS